MSLLSNYVINLMNSTTEELEQEYRGSNAATRKLVDDSAEELAEMIIYDQDYE